MRTSLPIPFVLYILTSHLFAFHLQEGSHSGSFKRPNGTEIQVYYYVPENLPKDFEIVFVMHGVKRNAEKYRDTWIDKAQKHRFVLICPEISKANFPGVEGFHHGNIFKENGIVNPKGEWSYTILDEVFNKIKVSNNLKQDHYTAYGHSAGAQFVHRMLLFYPENKAKRIIAAGAGWYTFPDKSINFPHGLKDSPSSDIDLAKVFEKKLIILVGGKDDDPNHKYLNKEPESMTQGKHRVERAKSFYKYSKKLAKELSLPFNWTHKKVSGVAHSNKQMSKAAVKYIFN